MPQRDPVPEQICHQGEDQEKKKERKKRSKDREQCVQKLTVRT